MNSIKIFLIILFLGFLGACETFTEPGKDNVYLENRVMKDPAFAEGILDYSYTRMPTAYTFDELATDDAVTNDKANTYLRMATGEWSALFNPLDTWSAAYASINNLNYFLSVVEKVQWSWLNPQRNALFMKRYKGEAYAIRGYWYAELLLKFGGIASNDILQGVPIVTEPLGVSDNWKLSRSTYQQCLDQIISDYNLALTFLPAKWENITDSVEYNRVFGPQNINRISGEVVKALKARILLHAASPAFNGGTYNMALCDSAAKNTGRMLKARPASGGPTSLPAMPPDYVFYDADADINNLDIIWRTRYSNSNTLEAANYPPSLFGNGRINPTQNLVDAFPMRNGYPITDPLGGFIPSNPYANRDPRLAKNILYNGATMRSTVINTSVTSPTTDGLNKLVNYSTRTGYYMLKHLRTTINMNPSGPGTARHFYTFMRWSEIYLIYAEAMNELNGPDADPYGYGFTPRLIIKAIRERAGITPTSDNYLASLTTKAQMREMIRNERRLELCFEGGFRFWDLRRWNLLLDETAKGVSISAGTGGVYTTIDVENRKYPLHGIYGPIPYQETIKYSGMLQNKGW